MLLVVTTGIAGTGLTSCFVHPGPMNVLEIGTLASTETLAYQMTFASSGYDPVLKSCELRAMVTSTHRNIVFD